MPFRGRAITPYCKIKSSSAGRTPTSTNATVQAWLNKIGTDGYTYPTQPQVDIYTTAWDYADAQGLTTQFDLVGLSKVPNINLTKIPFIHNVGSSARFVFVNENDVEFNSLYGWRSNILGTFDSYMDTNFNPATNSVNASQNNYAAGGFIYHRTTESLSTNTTFLGVQKTSAPTSRIGVRTNQGGVNALINNSTTSQATILDSVTDNTMVSGVRTNSANMQVYLGGATSATLVNTSAALPSFNLLIGATSSNGVFAANSAFDGGWIAFFYQSSGTIDQVKLNTFVGLLLT